SGVIGKPMLSDPSGYGVGNTFTVRFTSETAYSVDVSDAAGNAVYSFVGSGFTPGETQTIALQGGVQVDISGRPAAGDTFTVEPISTPPYSAVPAAGNSGSLVIGTPRIIDPSLSSPGDAFSVRFTSPTTYEVDLTDAQGNVLQASISAGTYD